MVFDRQQFERAQQVVEQRLFLGQEFPGIKPLSEIQLHSFETLDSTNQTLWALLDRGAPPGTVAIAAEQTAGRGQWGRHWQSPKGGLYLSVALAPNLAVSNSPQLTLCSAWGIAIALRCYGIPVRLKWPNDLLLSGRKLGGILTETRVQQGRIAKAVVGVGINWSNDVPESGINLQTFGKNLEIQAIASVEMLAAIVIEGLLAGYQHWMSAGIDMLLPSYLELLDSLGRRVTVGGNSGTVTGVSPTGELRVCLDSTPSAAIAGEPPSTVMTEIGLKPGTIGLGYSSL